MEKERVLIHGLEQRELQQRQQAEESQIETPKTLEELQERYADLAERMTALPAREPERIKDTPHTPTGRFLDRYVSTSFETGNEEIPELHLTLQTGHHIDEHDNYDPREATYLVVDWRGRGITSNGSQTNMTIQHEQLNQPNQPKNIANALHALGLIEESVAEAEKALLPALA